MCDTQLNCYITTLFLENNILEKQTDSYDNFGIKIIPFKSENLMMIIKIKPHTNNYHDKIIIDTNSLKPIVSFSNNLLFDNAATELLHNENWDNIEIIEYNFNSVHVAIFCNNNKWYISYHDKIVILINTENLYVKIFNDLLNNSDIINWKNNDCVYHLLLTHPMLCYVTQHDIKSITLLWVCDNNVNIVDNIDNNQIFNKNLKYFSCLDELQISLETECNNDPGIKTLTFGGYLFKIPYTINNHTQYICCVLRSNLYKYILSSLPKNTNKYISYLELYQKNELSDIISYVHKYPTDVIRRINMSIRTLSKEILNIYHLTRKKQNYVLYNSLTKKYKKILYELHRIYVTQKHNESKINTDIFKDKKSISVDIVYEYLKSVNIIDLTQLFKDRNEIIKTLTIENYDMKNVFNLNDIYIVTQIELMFGE